jgi:ferredoxin
MAKVPVIEADLCEGCETCVALCPDVFEMMDEKAIVTAADKCSECDCQEAIDTCPTEAIKWEEQ